MPVQHVAGLGHSPRFSWAALRDSLAAPGVSLVAGGGLQRLCSAAAPLLGCAAIAFLSACTPTRVTLTAEPLEMESIERVYVVAGAESVLAEKLGPDMDSRNIFDFTQSLKLQGTQESGALAYAEVRKLSPDEATAAEAAAAQVGGKPLASKRWRVANPSSSRWLSTKFDRLGDSILAELTKGGFKYNEEMSLAVIVGARDDRGAWKHYRTLISTADLAPGGFLFITRGKRLTFDLKADGKPERVLDGQKLPGASE